MSIENNKMDIESTIPPEMNIYIDNILGIKSTNPNYQNYFSSYSNLITILNELKLKGKKNNNNINNNNNNNNNNNKKSEKNIKQETIEQIENLSKNSAKNIKLEKEKNFNSISNFSTKNKTKYFQTAENDEIPPTLYAFYFCEKSKQILTDNQAATLKDAHIDTDYLKNSKDSVSEDFDNSINNNNINNNNYSNNNYNESNYNYNSNNNNLTNSNKEKNLSQLLNKKRKGSISNKIINKTSNKKNKKNEKNLKENNNNNNNKKETNNNSEEDNNSEDNNNNKNNNNNNNNEEYCLPTCQLGRKNTYNVMVMCDGCSKWFHALCVNEPENTAILDQKKNWLCPICRLKTNNESMILEKPMINNIKYNNNNNNSNTNSN